MRRASDLLRNQHGNPSATTMIKNWNPTLMVIRRRYWEGRSSFLFKVVMLRICQYDTANVIIMSRAEPFSG